jgi:hypothetical protein
VSRCGANPPIASQRVAPAPAMAGSAKKSRLIRHVSLVLATDNLVGGNGRIERLEMLRVVDTAQNERPVETR